MSRHGRRILCATVAAVVRRSSFLKECCVKEGVTGTRISVLRGDLPETSVQEHFTPSANSEGHDAAYRLTGRARSKRTRGLIPRSATSISVSSGGLAGQELAVSPP